MRSDIQAELKEEQGQDNLNVDMASRDTGEFQRYSTEIKGLEIVFYQALCGWQLKTKNIKGEILEMQSDELKRYFDVNRKMRYCNEEFASSLANSVYGLVSQITTTGNLTEREIYDLWDTTIDGFDYDILTDYHDQNNYDIKIESADRITVFCCSFSAYTKKARGGYTLQKFAENVLSIFQTKIGGVQNTAGKSLKDKILGGR